MIQEGFLYKVAEDIIRKHGWSNMDDLTLVFPSRRAGVVFKDLLKKIQHPSENESKTAILLPNITTLSDLFASLCPDPTIEELEAIFRLYKIYEKETKTFYDDERTKFEQNTPGKKYDEVKPFNLDVFYSWGRQLLADFNNIDSSEASKNAKELHDFFTNTIQAKELDKLTIDEEVRNRLTSLFHTDDVPEDSIRKKYEAIWKCMENIYTEFHKELADAHKLTSGMQKRWVISHWDEAKDYYEEFANQQFAFIGFNYLMPVEKELLAKIKAEKSNTLFYWDYVADFQTNKKAYSFIEKYMQDFPLPTGFESSTWTQKNVNIVAASSANAQAQYVHEWLSRNYKAGQRTAVVICDEQMLEPVIYALPNLGDGVNINITKGFPISSTKIYSEVIEYLSDKEHDRQANETYADVVSRVLDEVKKTDKKYQAEKHDKKQWQTLLIEESIYQVQVQLKQLQIVLQKEEYKDLIPSLTLLRSIVRRAMESVSLPFHGEPITDIQVMGVLETRALDFDNLLLLNVEEGVVPRKSNDSSFIPYYLRKIFRMQTREEEASVYAYNFFRLFNRANHITAVFSNAQTQLGAKSMSRFLMQIMTSDEFSTTRSVLTEGTNLPAPIEVDPQDSLLSKLEVHTDGYLYYKEKKGNNENNENNENKEQAKGNAANAKDEPKRFTLSPSALNTFIQCPRQFYLQYVEGLRSPDQTHTIFASNEIGTLVHTVMEKIYIDDFHCTKKEITQVKIDAGALAKVDADEKHLTQLLKEAYDKLNADNHTSYKYDEHPAENIVILKLVHKVLTHDIEDAKKGLQIMTLEHPGYYNTDIVIDEKGTTAKIQVGGIIDRLDICDNTMRVVDYKTGGYNKDKLDIKLDKLVSDPAQHYVLQTLIYAEAVAQKGISEKPLQPHLFFTQSKLKNTAVTMGGVPIADYNRLRPDTQTQKGIPTLIGNKVQEALTTTDFPQCDENKCTAFCPFLDICAREVTFNANK